ncbi:EAL domain-containing protein [Gilvimarinus agarilyticus]|uniref:putative bifunctional diguanylate cyclase/phosphodiesterase n=1 Tax=Gilvimarinus sp. 2_MG-2023 TaxID=3062666 RepID=UPI001C0967B1|nr:GGDEF and EAL domain-containing protein [Gilvimarinus sp. 2_MG-2023]MBU2887602.1 EAL domain-containing protein [Gilvimarinus agarilyticus]MDO6572253.1 EAL domain-containing protein [Gilvimarinus sp. 2_MG-2023]
MQEKLTAASLIKKYQRLFQQYDHHQIAERLVCMVAAKQGINRVALVLKRESEPVLCALAMHNDDTLESRSLTVPLSNSRNLPVDLISSVLHSGQHYSLSASELQPFAAQSGIVIPILEVETCLAAFYIEASVEAAKLSSVVEQLEPIWLMASLMTRQVSDRQCLDEQAERHRMSEQALWANETYLNAILRYSPALIAVKDLNGNVVMASDHYKQLAHIEDDSLVGKNALDIYPESLVESLTTMEAAALDNSRPYETELDLLHKDGTLHTYLMVKFPLSDCNEEVFGVCTICTDVSDRKMAESALREQQSRLNYMAFHDSLTALPNRSLFYDRINNGVARATRSGGKLALMLLDVDRFKNINDSLGHDSGDLLLKAIAGRLSEGVREMDTVARLGGDEFVVLLEGIQDLDDVRFVANKLLAHVSRPMEIAGHDISITASIGISVYPTDGDNTDELLKNADIAMYKAKEAGKNNCQFYAKGMSASAVNFLLLENDLRRGIEQDQLILHYQPQIDMRTGALTGVEALVRWQHPERGVVSPAHFIPLAEETGLIVPLGDWVLKAACEQQKQWLNAGLNVPQMAVNLSTRQFRQRDFPGKVATVLRETGLPAEFLELEITESCAMEHAGETINQLNQLNQMGLSLSIDDFGTGYSSLAYLKRFPIDKLKIDSSFIHDIPIDQNDAAIAKSIIGLAHNMQLTVVAEGVEQEQQASWLRDNDCDQVQGYLFAKPMPASSFASHFCARGEFDVTANVVSLKDFAQT